MGIIGWIVGSPLGRLVGVVLLVGLLSIGAILYIQSAERDKINVEKLQQEIETRDRVDEAIKRSPNSLDGIAEFLRDRQSDRD